MTIEAESVTTEEMKQAQIEAIANTLNGWRHGLAEIFIEINRSSPSRERDYALKGIQEAIMWLGREIEWRDGKPLA